MDETNCESYLLFSVARLHVTCCKLESRGRAGNIDDYREILIAGLLSPVTSQTEEAKWPT